MLQRFHKHYDQPMKVETVSITDRYHTYRVSEGGFAVNVSIPKGKMHRYGEFIEAAAKVVKALRTPAVGLN